MCPLLRVCLKRHLPPADEEYDVWPDVDVEAEYGEGSYGFGGGGGGGAAVVGACFAPVIR